MLLSPILGFTISKSLASSSLRSSKGVRYHPNFSASISIANGKILEGKLGKRQKELLKAWMLIHKEEIWDRWNNAVAGEYIDKIEPKQI
jgi:hypothetical protein